MESQLRLEGISGDLLVQAPCSKHGQQKQIAQGCVPLGFEYLQIP